jgi:hypothetical protein
MPTRTPVPRSPRSTHGRWTARRLEVLLVAVALVAGLLVSRAAPAEAAADGSGLVRIANSVPDPVANGTAKAVDRAPADDPRTVTVTLQRTDEAGFERFAAALRDPESSQYRHFSGPTELTERFGPSQDAYDAVRGWLVAGGLSDVQDSDNRLTISASGSRSTLEQVFGVTMGDFEVAGRRFASNTDAPVLPASIARYVTGVSGLNDLARGTTPQKKWLDGQHLPPGCAAAIVGFLDQLFGAAAQIGFFALIGPLIMEVIFLELLFNTTYLLGQINSLKSFADWATGPLTNCLAATFGAGGRAGGGGRGSSATQSAGAQTQGSPAPTASTQKIGFVAYDSFRPSDVASWLQLTNADPTIADRVSQVNVNGGVPTPGADQSEVLLDIAAAVSADTSSGTSYVVYSAPPTTGFAQIFNDMVNDHVTVISNSWSQCEDETTLAEAQSIDSVLAQAAASGITVLNATGDSGSSCLDGSPNTIGVPADSPHATAVGGTSFGFGKGFSYGTETWWDGSAQTPATGQGGYGVSKFFPRPTYQDGRTGSTMRSIPDLVVPADPNVGIVLCEADAGGCPGGLVYGGTSMSAPGVAGMVTSLNKVVGTNLGEANPVVYPMAGTKAFHTLTGPNNDFAHVGLGSPNLPFMAATLRGQSIGAVSAARSTALALSNAPADGTKTVTVKVNLVDGNGYPVGGKNVALTPVGPSSATVSAASGPSNPTGW